MKRASLLAGLGSILGLGKKPIHSAPNLPGFNPSNTIPTGRLIIRETPVPRNRDGRRAERRDTGISARSQRRRRRETAFPAEYGTRRGLRKYLGLLKRAAVYVRNPGDRFGVIERNSMHGWEGVRRGVCSQMPNRAQRRWLERWWTAEEKEA